MSELPPSRLKEDEAIPIAELESRQRAVVRGRIVAMTYPSEAAPLQLRAHMKDATGTLIVQWPGRREIPGLRVGTEIAVEGTVSWQQTELIMSNPTYQIISEDE